MLGQYISSPDYVDSKQLPEKPQFVFTYVSFRIRKTANQGLEMQIPDSYRKILFQLLNRYCYSFNCRFKLAASKNEVIVIEASVLLQAFQPDNSNSSNCYIFLLYCILIYRLESQESNGGVILREANIPTCFQR